MSRRWHALFPALALSVLLSGCGVVGKWFRPKPKPVSNTPQDLFIGNIESVNPEQHFVLIRTMMRTTLQAGAKLETRPATGSSARLTVTPEQKLNFLAADISEGFPQVGDTVVLPPQLPVTTPAGEPAPPIQLPLPAGGLPPPIQ